MKTNWFGDSIDYPGLTELLEETAKSLYPNNELSDVANSAAKGNQLALLEYEDMLGQVLDASYTREPQLFGNILWINTDLGTPMWVRPGETWIPPNDYHDSEPKMKRTTIANRSAFLAAGASIFEQAITNYTEQQIELMRDTQ